ncbi:hypothetical protein GO285_01464 [Ralstonia solanacearum]|nr:hypothetical protein [Ralstonia solanacearum]NKG09686.1 hypothetical protein [Ralstonia solanacearum]
MTAFKDNVYEICRAVCDEFPEWKFVSGQFVNRSLKHTELQVYLGFGFRHGSTAVVPSVTLLNKRVTKLGKQVLGGGGWFTSLVNLQTVAQLLTHTPEKRRTSYWIHENKEEYFTLAPPTQAVRDQTIDISEARDAIIATMKDAIAFINSHYDLSSEENFLKGLPAKYETRHPNSPYDQMDGGKGVALCLVKILLGDFDFIGHYMSDDFKTIFPKQMNELQKIADALPDLKRRYTETGSVI